MSSRVVGDQRKSMDARLQALHTAAPSPELASAALRLIEDVEVLRPSKATAVNPAGV